MEWRTLVDGNREAPILLNTSTGEWIDPMKLVWSKVKAGGKVNLPEVYRLLVLRSGHLGTVSFNFQFSFFNY